MIIWLISFQKLQGFQPDENVVSDKRVAKFIR